jgi:hypothetical protein
MTDREIMQQALETLLWANAEIDAWMFDGRGYGPEERPEIIKAVTALQERLAHCDRCGKKLGGEGDIHTCTLDPIGDAQDKLIAEMAAQPEPEPVADERNKLAAWMMAQGYATGHGDTMEGLLEELGGQVIIRMVRVAEERVKAEREACAKVADDYFGFNAIADAIRARGQA